MPRRRCGAALLLASSNCYLQFTGALLVKVMPGPGLGIAKNPEGVASHGPLHSQNCTAGAGALQTVCRDANGRCEAFDSAFRVDVFDIAAG